MVMQRGVSPTDQLGDESLELDQGSRLTGIGRDELVELVRDLT